jgi:hypothetical protein
VPWKALTFSAVIFGVSLMIYAGLSLGYKSFLTISIDGIKSGISDLDRIAPKEESEKEFVRFYSQVTNIQRLLGSHLSVDPMFELLEANTVPEVAYSSVNIGVTDKTVTMDGYAKSYSDLANQLAIYENVPGVAKVSLSTARFSEEAVRFETRIDFSEDFFNFQAAYSAAAPTDNGQTDQQ